MDAVMVKRVLMIAYHYPPVLGSSGVQRALKFSRYLPEYGWQPIVLTVHPRAYAQTTDGQMDEIADGAIVKRAFALDTSRHLSFRGAYPRLFALPDRWASWWLGAVPAGLRLIRRYRPQVLWSTYPIATAHMIGLTLSRASGVPWIADFRDSMTEEHYPEHSGTRRVYRWIERNTVHRCHHAVFTTPGAIKMYAQRYPDIPGSRWVKIENAFDEDNFREAERTLARKRAATSPLVLLHSGLLYPSERDPAAFFAALEDLCAAGSISNGEVKIVLRASGYDDYYSRLIEQYNLGRIVELLPAVSYREALTEMLSVDGLLIFQAANCNHQIPAKIYEYLRARRPILALTDPAGDTAGVLRAAGVDTIVPIDAKEQIAAGLQEFLARIREGRAPIATETEIARHTRRARTQELAGLLDSAAAP